MRRLFFVLALALAACGGSGGSGATAPEPVQHVPEISNLRLSPGSALYGEGDGSTQVTAEFEFADIGLDIETLRVEMSDGTRLTLTLAGQVDTASGTLSKVFDVTTRAANGCTIEIWLVDRAGQASNRLSANFDLIRHAPEITDLQLSSDSALYMQGDGGVGVTAEITFRDIGRDISALWIRMPDGTTTRLQRIFATETGTFAEEFTISTESVGTFAIEFWLADKVGDNSNHVSPDFEVTIENVHTGEWTNRLGALPYVLYDVVWDGAVFIAVGNSGAILTSADGVDWVARDATTDTSLYAVAAHGRDIFAVGYQVVLHSTDHGETWSVRSNPDYIFLSGIALSSSQVVALGGVPDLLIPKAMLSEDLGDTWQISDYSWLTTDLISHEGRFIATAMHAADGSSVTVSSDGKVWNGIRVREGYTRLDTIVHDGSQFVVAGESGRVFTSLDSINWMEIPTPFDDVDYGSAAWNGSLLVLAGRMSQYWRDDVYRPIGISSTDGGATWEIFDIDTNYQSNSMAWGNGRFVSVGWTSVSDKGAIYTTE